MPQVTFIRHYKLAPPYDHKDHMSEIQRQELALGKVDPDINPDIQTYLSELEQPELFTNIDLVFASPTSRALQTANAMKSHFKLGCEIEAHPELREVPWDPSLGPGRIKRFIESTGTNSISEVWQRFAHLEMLIKSHEVESTLCVTHSFLIQNLYLYFERSIKNHGDVTDADIRDSLLAGYLEGFTLELMN